jgi:hypothetical protein
MTSVEEAIRREATEIELESSVLAEAHSYSASRWSRINLWIGLPTTLLAAAAGVTAITELIANEEVRAAATAALAVGAAALSAVTTFLNPSGQAAGHQAANCQYRDLRRRISFLKDIDLPLGTLEVTQSLRDRVDDLKKITAQLGEVDQASPRPLRSLYRKAQKKYVTEEPSET